MLEKIEKSQSVVNVPEMINKLKKQAQEGDFIPRQIWLYSEDPEKDEEYTRVCMRNTLKVA